MRRTISLVAKNDLTTTTADVIKGLAIHGVWEYGEFVGWRITHAPSGLLVNFRYFAHYRLARLFRLDLLRSGVDWRCSQGEIGNPETSAIVKRALKRFDEFWDGRRLPSPTPYIDEDTLVNSEEWE